MTPPNPSPPPREHASTSSNDTGIIKTLLFLRARRVIFPDPMRPFEFPIPFRVLLRKLCAPIQALRLQRRDPPLVPSQTFLRLQQRPQPRRIRIIAPEFRITSRFQVIQPYDFRVARRAAAAARRRLRLLTVCASFGTAVAPSVARRARHPAHHPARPRARPRVFARVLARRSALDAPLPFAFAFAFAFALDVAVALTPRVAPVARADDDVAHDVDARLATSRATRRHMSPVSRVAF